MTEMNRTAENVDKAGLDNNLDRLDQDLAIMDRHATEMARAEQGVQDSMRKWDREYKDERLHSVPKPRKHAR